MVSRFRSRRLTPAGSRWPYDFHPRGINTPEEEVLEISHSVHEVAFNATVGTDWLILPSVSPVDSCPVRR